MKKKKNVEKGNGKPLLNLSAGVLEIFLLIFFFFYFFLFIFVPIRLSCGSVSMINVGFVFFGCCYPPSRQKTANKRICSISYWF